MAADFNAGSIEGTLDLDTRPFASGLRKAQMQADEFERKKVAAHLGLDKGDFDAKKDEASAELDKMDHTKTKPKIELSGVPSVLAALGLVRTEMDKTESEGSKGGGLLGFVKGIALNRVTMLAAGFVSLAAAAGPATAAVIAFGAAAGAAFGGAMLAFGLFAKVVESDYAKIEKAIKGGTQLAGPAGVAETALKHLTSAWAAFQKASGGVGYRFLATAFDGLAGVLPKLVPLLKTTGSGLSGVVRQVLALAHRPIFGAFLKQLQGFMHGLLSGLGPVLTQTLTALMHGFIALRPLMSQLGTGIEKASQALSHFASGGGLQKFLGYAQHALPSVEHLVGDLFRTLVNLGHSLGPLAGPALHFIDALVKGLGHINLGPVAASLGHLFTSLSGDVPAVVAALNKLVPVISVVVAALAKIAGHKDVVVTILGLVGAFKALSVVKSVASSVAGFVSVMRTLVELQKVEGFMAAVAAISPKLAVGFRLVGVAVKFMMGPWGLLLTALVALGVGLVEAYKHSQTFRDIVNGAFHAVESVARTVFDWLKNAVASVIDFIRAHWQMLVGIFLGPLGLVVALVISHFSQIRSFISNAISDVVHFVRNGLDNVAHFFGSLPGRIAGFFGGMVSAGVRLFTGVFDGIKQVGSEILSWCASLPGRIISAIGNIGGDVLHSVEGSITSSLSGIGSFIKGHIPHLAGGGVTNGRMLSMIGDNAGGREAVIPLNEFDLPSRGETAALAAAASAASRSEMQLLRASVQEQTAVLKQLRDKADAEPAPVTIAEPSLKRLQQAVRSQ